MGFYNIINSLFKNIFATFKVIRKLLFMVIFVVIIVVLLENTCFAATTSKTIEITNFEQGSIDPSNGTLVFASNIIRTDLINLPEGDYTLSYSGIKEVCSFLYDSNGSFDKLLFTWTSGEVDFHLNGNFSVIFLFRNSSNSIATPSDISDVYLLYMNSDPNVDYTESLDIINSNISNGFNVIDNTLTNSNINLDNNLPTIQFQDITQFGFGELFTKIQNAFTKEDIGASVKFTIPFVNQTFTIDFFTIYSNFNLKFVTQIVTPFWYFIVSLYIIKDIAKQLNKLKSGNVDNVANENVKEDLL